MSNKITYLCDGNFYLHKTLSVCGAFDEQHPMFLKDDSPEKMEKDKNYLIHKLTMDFCSDIRKAAVLIDEVIITMDDYSWRNDFFEDKAYQYATVAEEKKQTDEEIVGEAIDYKGHRVKEKSFNWSLVYQTFEEFLVDMRNIGGIKWARMNGCEGDDIIFAVATHYIARGKSVMIYSGDNDLKQLISFNPINNSFVIHFKKTEKKIVMSNDTAKWLMNNESLIKSKLTTFAHENEVELLAENAFDIIFTKILTGDKGDNVMPSIQEMRTYKSGAKKGQDKLEKIGKRVIDKVKVEIDYKRYNFLDFFNEDFLNTLTNSVLRNFKPISHFNPENIKNNIKINRDLMFLHKNCIPHSIYETMLDWIEQNEKEMDLKIREMYSYKSVLERNPHYTHKEEAKTTSANIFKQLGL